MMDAKKTNTKETKLGLSCELLSELDSFLYYYKPPAQLILHPDSPLTSNFIQKGGEN